MLQNYFKTALRNLFRNKSFSLINILGLSAGMAICMLIIAILKDQNSYDSFHSKKDRIYRIVCDRTSDSPSSFATSPPPIYSELMNNYAGIEEGLRIKASLRDDARLGEQITPMSGLFVDPSFFELFDFELKYGDEKTALNSPFSIILTETAAKKLGIENQNPIDQTIQFSNLGDFRITGIVQDPPQKSHIQFEALASYASTKPLGEAEQIYVQEESWSNTNYHFNYFLLENNVSAESLAANFKAISDEKYADSEDYRLDFRLQSLNDITPSEILENDMSTTLPQQSLFFLSLLAIIVLLTACFNYTNLSVARALTRAREVGVRKVVGAMKAHIFLQFISEAVLVSLLSLFIAWGLLETIVIPGFQSLSLAQFLDLDLSGSLPLYLTFLGFSIVTGVLAGLLPAVYLSRFQPIQVLKSLSQLKVFARFGWRKALMVVQFVVSLVFIISVNVLYNQTQHMMAADYGFDKTNVLNLRTQGQDFEKIKNEFSRHSSVISISGSSYVPAIGARQEMSYRTTESGEDLGTDFMSTDENFLSTFDISLLAGRNFDEESTNNQLIINEIASKRLGYENPSEAIGGTLLLDARRGNGTLCEIIGVTPNFVYQRLSKATGCLMLQYAPERLRYANLKIETSNIPATLTFIEKTWEKLDPVHTASYFFLQDRINRNMGALTDIFKILGFLSMIAIAITCLGLLGIATYSVETRTKEIGIRKVLGASIDRIIWTLSKGLVYPIGIAIVLGLPIAWFVNSSWLQDMAYRISLNPLNLGLGVLIMILLGGSIVGSQAWRIARRNPVNALRAE